MAPWHDLTSGGELGAVAAHAMEQIPQVIEQGRNNGHVEQKNWTRVRQLSGYDRFEDPGLVERINALYVEVWEPLHNFSAWCI